MTRHGNLCSIIVLILVLGHLGLAFVDEKARLSFGDLAKVGVGGFFGRLLPER